MILRALCLLILSFWGIVSFAQIPEKTTIAIIIDDIGYRVISDREALNLPGNITYAIMPNTPNAERMSRIAKKNGKHVIAHLSMQPMDINKHHLMGPGALTVNMNKNEFMETVKMSLKMLPDAVGVNNHMGSLLTQSKQHMKWLMESLDSKTLFYIDSVTVGKSVARSVAKERNIPYLKRDIFLDNEQNTDYIQKQFNKLIALSRKNGYAIAIGHPHNETINVLRNNLDKLESLGVSLESVVDLVSLLPVNKTVQLSIPHQKLLVNN